VDTEVFRPGLDTTGLRDSLGIRPEEKLIFSVGRLSRRKGFDQTLRAIAQLKVEGLPVRYVIGGIGEDADYLDRLIKELRLQGITHRIGAVSEADLPRWMNACDVFAMPNREIDGDNEGFGMVFIEAAACGKTAIAGMDGGTGAAVLDGETGIRVNGAIVEDIARALDELIRNPRRQEKFGQAALMRVVKEFSWERVTAKTQELEVQK
jgi:phosphatidylinositol alpha-1,6-mannosyltransferase